MKRIVMNALLLAALPASHGREALKNVCHFERSEESSASLEGRKIPRPSRFARCPRDDTGLGGTSPVFEPPRLFAEGVVSTSDDEFGGSFTPSGDTVYFTKSAPHSYRYTMLESYRVHGAWTIPEVLPFSGRYTDSDPTLSPDGKKMFWTSDRPVSGKVKHDYDIWMVERTTSGAWGAPQRLPAPINSDASEYAASMTRDGTLYFSSAREGAIEAYRSAFVNGVWAKPENITRLINHGDSTPVFDLDVMIDPDERFLILGSLGRRASFGNWDLYVAWRDNGAWTPAIHLPAPFNTRARDYAPHLSPDGATLFFSSERGFALDSIDRPLNYRELTDRLRGTLNGSGNIYQISLSGLESLHPPATTGPEAACPEGVAATFGWWVGNWAYAIPGYDPATSVVTSSNAGCSLAEAFVDRTGQQQHTTMQYDSTSGEWKRRVVDPFRTYTSAGRFASDGSIAFYETKIERETYRPIDRDHVHFIGEKSNDGGKTWQVLFDATYTRRP